MSNKAFVAVVVMILVVFALIYVVTPSTTEDVSDTSSVITQEKGSKRLLSSDDITEDISSQKQTIKASSEKEKQTVNIVSPGIEETETTKKKKEITIRADSPKVTKPLKTIRFPDEETDSTTSSEANSATIRVNWENENRKEKGAYTIIVDSETILTKEIVANSIEEKGYILTSIQVGQEYIGEKAIQKEYTFNIKVNKSSEN